MIPGKTKVCIFGLGYVGLPTAALLANGGFNVLGVDIQPAIIKGINSGAIHIHEPGLEAIVSKCVKAGRLKASAKPSRADVFIITVPTPIRPDTSPDISYVESAVEMAAPHIRAGNLLIVESTCPVGATERAAEILRQMRPDLDVPFLKKNAAIEKNSKIAKNSVLLCYCPERVLPGNILSELVNNSRIIGGMNKASAEKAQSFYSKVVKGTLFLTDCRTAEMAKLSENTFRDVNIALANELSLIAKKYGVDPHELVSLSNHHPRVNVHQPGCGVGGHCIPVDPWFLHHNSENIAKLIRTARNINDGMPSIVVKEIMSVCKGIKNPTIALLGLSYKPDTDDLRESPAVEVARILSKKKIASIIVVEPFIKKLPGKLAGCDNVKLSSDLAATVSSADAVALLVPHSLFKDIDPQLVIQKKGRIVDPAGAWKEMLL